MDCLLFLKNSTLIFSRISLVKKVKKSFLILVESISFDAKPDEGEGYMVALVFSAFILIQTVIFAEKVKFRNGHYFPDNSTSTN
jgi:hypothetical protein